MEAQRGFTATKNKCVLLVKDEDLEDLPKKMVFMDEIKGWYTIKKDNNPKMEESLMFLKI